MSTVVCITDEILELQLRKAGALAPLIAGAITQQRIRRAAPEPAPRSAGVARAADPAAPRVDYRPSAPVRFALRLSHGGMDAMRRDWVGARSRASGVGGYLWAHQRARSDGVIVAHVSPPAEGSRHSRTSVRLGKPESVAAAWPDWLQRSQLVCVGCWHSHPITDGTPSRPDREAWAARVKRTGFPWASLIVSRGEDGMGWMDPQFTGWVTSPDGRGGYTCGPAKVARP